MARSNLFNREVRASKSPRNAFDLGYSSRFSTPVGLLLPAYVQEVKAGDKIGWDVPEIDLFIESHESRCIQGTSSGNI